MKRFKNILYIVNGERDQWNSIDKVQDLARLNNAAICIARIQEKDLTVSLSQLIPGKDIDLTKYALEQHHINLETVMSDDGWRDIDVQSTVLQGRGFLEVIKKVLKDGHDLVITEDPLSHGVSQLSMRLIRKCPCPVWVMKRKESQAFRHILCAVDLQNTRPENLALNRKIIELCSSLAQREQGEAHYLHAWMLDFDSILRSPRFNIGTDEIEKMKNELRNEREQMFKKLLEDCFIQPEKNKVHLIEGETVDVIERFLKKLSIDVIVMGTVGRTGISGLLIGNKAEKLLNNINCTVLAVKPDGFVSPVNLDD